MVRLKEENLNAAALSAFHVSTAPNTGFNTKQGAERSGNNQRMLPLKEENLNAAALSAFHVSAAPNTGFK